MLELYILLLFSLFINLNIPQLLAEKNEINIKSNPTEKIDWESISTDFENQLNWYEVDEDEINQNQKKIKTIAKKANIYTVRSIGKGVNVNGSYYSDISNYVPNAYVEDPSKVFGLSTRGISKTRFCNGKNFSKGCIDGVLDIDFKLFNNNNISIFPKINLQSLSNRGTKFGKGTSLGVKIAKELSSNWSIAFGGENIFHFDETIDLGHNFFVIASTYLPLSSSKNLSFLFVNFGIGSDFYGYKGNGFLFRTPCGNNTLTGTFEKPNSCSWGPIGSVAYSMNDRFSLISEWFGYSYGAGFSVRPYRDNSFNISFFATDFIKGFPKYAENYCTGSICQTRFYGTISITF
tara:strand:- start:1456 stop:2499 length:1044 start_codon:yes stop_codon:yes gene_type:complete